MRKGDQIMELGLEQITAILAKEQEIENLVTDYAKMSQVSGEQVLTFLTQLTDKIEGLLWD